MSTWAGEPPVAPDTGADGPLSALRSRLAHYVAGAEPQLILGAEPLTDSDAAPAAVDWAGAEPGTAGWRRAASSTRSRPAWSCTARCARSEPRSHCSCRPRTASPERDPTGALPPVRAGPARHASPGTYTQARSLKPFAGTSTSTGANRSGRSRPYPCTMTSL